ncbi:hypothetical protein MSG28_002689 [Choristoneura fumiferana]|uniref:Uncharacterized protein n=1 Tax=Choristoneura fumiferana TaxID=7141 RepID=A0ACC0JIW8_CHOFU|nr:hypothetical protein MSG28_002689 [Choristoneura fumiferana]
MCRIFSFRASAMSRSDSADVFSRAAIFASLGNLAHSPPAPARWSRRLVPALTWVWRRRRRRPGAARPPPAPAPLVAPWCPHSLGYGGGGDGGLAQRGLLQVALLPLGALPLQRQPRWSRRLVPALTWVWRRRRRRPGAARPPPGSAAPTWRTPPPAPAPLVAPPGARTHLGMEAAETAAWRSAASSSASPAGRAAWCPHSLGYGGGGDGGLAQRGLLQVALLPLGALPLQRQPRWSRRLVPALTWVWRRRRRRPGAARPPPGSAAPTWRTPPPAPAPLVAPPGARTHLGMEAAETAAWRSAASSSASPAGRAAWCPHSLGYGGGGDGGLAQRGLLQVALLPLGALPLQRQPRWSRRLVPALTWVWRRRRRRPGAARLPPGSAAPTWRTPPPAPAPLVAPPGARTHLGMEAAETAAWRSAASSSASSRSSRSRSCRRSSASPPALPAPPADPAPPQLHSRFLQQQNFVSQTCVMGSDEDQHQERPVSQVYASYTPHEVLRAQFPLGVLAAVGRLLQGRQRALEAHHALHVPTGVPALRQNKGQTKCRIKKCGTDPVGFGDALAGLGELPLERVVLGAERVERGRERVLGLRFPLGLRSWGARGEAGGVVPRGVGDAATSLARPYLNSMVRRTGVDPLAAYINVVSSRNIYPKKVETRGLRRMFSEKVETEAMSADYEHVKKATTDSKVLIVDVREPDEVKEHGKIPNSINIPLGTVSSVLSQMPESEFQNTFKRQKPTEDTELIFYCMIGKRSGKAQESAIKAGTKNYLGSWNDWASRQAS